GSRCARSGRSALLRDGVDALAHRERERALEAKLDRQDHAVEEADHPGRLRGAPTDAEAPEPAEEAGEVVVAERGHGEAGALEQLTQAGGGVAAMVAEPAIELAHE